VAHAAPTGVENITIAKDPMEAVSGAHAICVLTEWDEFKDYDYQKIYDSMVKPAFIFDGRNILDHDKLRDIGFVVYSLGKPLDPFLHGSYN
jgi:UDPglucose 6-dehydrogenase